MPSWLAWKEGMSVPAARRQVTAARALRDSLPATARSARTGDITTEHIGILVGVAATSQARRDAVAAPVEAVPAEAAPAENTAENGEEQPVDNAIHPTGEETLLRFAAQHSLKDFTRIARRFAHISDPESDERGYRLAQEREHLDLSRTLGGFHVAGFLTEEHGQLVKTALDAIIGVPSADDNLTSTQRRASALAGLATLVLDKGLTGSGAAVRPHLSVLVPWTDFRALASGMIPDVGTAGRSPRDLEDLQDLETFLASPGATWEDGTGPVPGRLLRKIAADCQLTRIVFGPESEILNVGRTQRTLAGAKRRAVIARDRHCIWPTCDAPPQLGQIHHADRHWADGGETSTDNAALLCWFHHQHVDTRNIAMHWNNGWKFHEPGSYQAA